MTAGGRTTLVALLVAAVGVRISASQPLAPAVARIANDPGASLRHAADGWTLTGTLGGASAQGLRDLPLAILSWLWTRLGANAEVVQTSWRVLVLLIALLGAVRLARALAPDEGADSWVPWFAAVVFSSGIVLVPTVVRSPLDGLAAATLPWVVAPLLTGKLGWRQAATSAAWLGLAGVGSPLWAAGALVAALVAAAPRTRDEVLPALRWLLLALISCGWWVAAFVWESRHAHDVSALTGGAGVGKVLTDAVGRPGLAAYLLVLGVLGPLLVCVGSLLLRPRGGRLGFVAGLCGAAAVVAAAWFAGWSLPVFVPPGDAPASMLGPLLGWISLAALVGWTPLFRLLSTRTRLSTPWRLPSDRRELASLGIGAAIVLTSAAGLVAAASEPGHTGHARAGLLAEVEAWSDDAPPGRVLVLPAGSDDAAVPSVGVALQGRPWVGRDALPASGAAATSALDDLLRRLARGDGGPGTTSAVQRLGIAYVLLHLDGSVATDRANPSALVRASLATQGGRRVSVLSGREGGDEVTPAERLLDFGVRSTTEQVEIWSLPGVADGWTYDGPPLEVEGDTATPSDLADAGALGSRAIRLRSGSTTPVDLLSDSARRRDVDQRVPVDPYGPDLGADEPRSVVPPEAVPVTTASRRLSGARAVRASSSAADLDGADRRAGTDAMAAADGNIFTSWQSRRGTGTGEWWQIELDAPTDLSGASVQFVRNSFAGQPVTRVRVTTDEGATDYDVPADGLLALRGGEPTSRLRITVTEGDGTTDADDSVGINEVTVPGVRVRDALAVAGPPAAGWLLAARPGSFTHCVPAVPMAQTTREPEDLATVCDRGVAVDGPDTGRLDRVIELAEPTVVTGRAWSRAADTAQSATLATRLARPTVTVTGTSVAAQDLVTRPQAAADADASTAWRPAPEDTSPALTLTWSDLAEVSGLDLALLTDVASTPTRVRVAAEVPGRGTVTTEAEVGQDGSVTFPRVLTRSMTITFLDYSALTSVGSLIGGARHVPIAVAEVGLVGGPDVAYDGDVMRELDCGSGPVVSLGGKDVTTAVTTSARDVVAGGLVRADLCEEVDLGAGEVEVGVAASFSWIPLGVLLTSPGGAIEALGVEGAGSSPDRVAAIPPTLGRLGTRGSVTVDLADSSTERTMTLAVPAGSGWQAHGAEGPLEPVTVDSWSQGWAVPAGVSQVELRYSAGGGLRGSVGAGAAGWALVVLLAVVGALSVGRRDQRMAGRSTHT